MEQSGLSLLIKKAFRYGISGRNFSDLKKVIINKLNILLKWKDRLTD